MVKRRIKGIRRVREIPGMDSEGVTCGFLAPQCLVFSASEDTIRRLMFKALKQLRRGLESTYRGTVRYLFRNLEINEDEFVIRRNGTIVHTEPRVLEVLVYLLRHRHRLVPKSELLEQVWRGDHVGDAAITRAVSIARQVIADPVAIRTVHSRGYQWVAAVRVASRTRSEDTSAPPASARS